jgi:protein SCO1/2
MSRKATLTMPDRFARLAFTILIAAASLAVGLGWQRAVAQQQLRDGAPVQLNNSLPMERKGVTVDQNLGARIPLNLPLTDSQGRRVKTGYFIDGQKPTIITLNYSDCPMLCNVQLNQLTQSLDKLSLKIGQDFQLLTVSIDPREPTSKIRETKEKYVGTMPNQPGASSGWAFCTAKQPIITRLADVLGFRYKYDRNSKQYNHPAMLAFVSPEGVITRYSLQVDFPPDQLKMALVEAGEGSVGSPVDQFILWCYSYDPSSNSYTPAAWKIMRVSGAAMICVTLACLLPYWVGRRRDPQGEHAAEESDTESSTESDNQKSDSH